MNNTDIDDRTQQEERMRAQDRGPRRADSAHRESAHESRGARAASRIEVDRLREVGRNLGEQLDEQVRKRPYVVLGAAAGAGFVAGSVLGSRQEHLPQAAGVGYAAKHVLGGEFGLDRLQAGLERLTGEFEAKAERGSGRS